MKISDLKFRGLTAKGAWVFGLPGIVNLVLTRIKGSGYSYLIIPETLGMYTGFQDDNGVDIYTGDILFDREPESFGSDCCNADILTGECHGKCSNCGDACSEVFAEEVYPSAGWPVVWHALSGAFMVDLSYNKDTSYLEPLVDNLEGMIIKGNIHQTVTSLTPQ